MRESASIAKESAKSLSRLMPRLEARFAEQVDKGMWQSYVQRLNTHFPSLFRRLYQLYGTQYDCF